MRSSTKFSNGNTGGFDNDLIIKQKDFEEDIPYVFRVVGTNIPVRSFFYPTLREDKENGGMKSSFNGIVCPIDCEEFGWSFEPTIVDELVTLDTRVRNLNKPGNSKPIRSKLKPSIKYYYPVFDVLKDDGIIYYLEASWQVHDGICKLQSEKYDRDPSKLLHGPIFVADIVVTKKKKDADKKKKAKSEHQNIMYTVRSASGNKFAGKFPIAVLEDRNADKLEKLFDLSVKQGIYTEEEFQTILAHDQNVWAEKFRPQSNDEIQQQLLEYPIQLDGQDWEGRPYFANPELYYTELETLGLTYSTGDVQALPDNSGDTEKETPKKKAPKKEVVDEELPADLTSEEDELNAMFAEEVDTEDTLEPEKEVKPEKKKPVVNKLTKEEKEEAKKPIDTEFTKQDEKPLSAKEEDEFADIDFLQDLE